MARRKKPVNEVNERVANYRARAEQNGLQRVETTVSMEDAKLIKDIAKILRRGDESADQLRTSIRTLLPARQAQTSDELLAFFRGSPWALEDDELKLAERDRSSGRSADRMIAYWPGSENKHPRTYISHQSPLVNWYGAR